MRLLFAALLLVISSGAADAAPVTLPSVTFTGGSTTIYMGDQNIETAGDNGNGNLLVAQSAVLAQTATLQSLSFYVTTASGNLVLGVYDATGASGRPGNLLAQTASLVPHTGWNTVVTTTQPSLPAGNYWLAYGPSSNTLSFVKKSGTCYYYSRTFSATLPATFATSLNACASAWSFYATLLGGPPPPVNGVCGMANGAAVYLAPSTNLCAAGNATAVTGSGPWNWSCIGINGGTTAACSAPLQPDGPLNVQLSNTMIGLNNAGMTVGSISTVPPGYPGVIVLSGTNGSSFVLTNGGRLPSDVAVGPVSLPAGTYHITLTAN